MAELLKLPFNLLAIGNIPGNLRGANHGAIGIANRRDCQRDRDERAVLTPANRVEMLDAFAAADAPEHHLLFREAVWRNHHRDGLPDRLFGGVAEQLLGAAIPGGDDAVEIFADD